MNLHLGGEEVRQAEAQAVDFYASKAGRIEDRLDALEAELLQRIAFRDAAIRWFDLDATGESVVALSQAGELRRFPVAPLRELERMELRQLTDAERQRFALR